MSFLSICFVCVIYLQMGIFAELSLSSGSFLRTPTSITIIVPEVAQHIMRYYCTLSLSQNDDDAKHHCQKCFLFSENASRGSSSSSIKESILEKVPENTSENVDATKIAILVINNNETG